MKHQQTSRSILQEKVFFTIAEKKQSIHTDYLPELISNPPALLYASPVSGIILLFVSAVSAFLLSFIKAIGSMK